ncbi:MAG: pyridoxamine 5'-phosphate oxidase family protein [Dehalococcoidia bacterium]|nr:pyridoxamine 5'-phosphate oxidase family protein [Dehalococcoidia bacterium]
MANLTEEMKAMVGSQQAFVATASPDGVPNIGTKGSTYVLDDEHIVFYEMMGGRTWENLQKNPKVAIAVADRSALQGYRFVGTAEFITEGELYEGAKKLAEMLKSTTPPKAAVKVKVEEIYNLGMGGLKVA